MRRGSKSESILIFSMFSTVSSCFVNICLLFSSASMASAWTEAACSKFAFSTAILEHASIHFVSQRLVFSFSRFNVHCILFHSFFAFMIPFGSCMELFNSLIEASMTANCWWWNAISSLFCSYVSFKRDCSSDNVCKRSSDFLRVAINASDFCICSFCFIICICNCS